MHCDKMCKFLCIVPIFFFSEIGSKVSRVRMRKGWSCLLLKTGEFVPWVFMSQTPRGCASQNSRGQHVHRLVSRLLSQHSFPPRRLGAELIDGPSIQPSRSTTSFALTAMFPMGCSHLVTANGGVRRRRKADPFLGACRTPQLYDWLEDTLHPGQNLLKTALQSKNLPTSSSFQWSSLNSSEFYLCLLQLHPLAASQAFLQ